MLTFHAAQTGKHLLRTQNVSEQNEKHFLCFGHKISVPNKCCARGQTGTHFQCVRNYVCSFARALRTSVTHLATPHVPLFCSYHILTSSVIYY